jgi:hypothetical protein
MGSEATQSDAIVNRGAVIPNIAFNGTAIQGAGVQAAVIQGAATQGAANHATGASATMAQAAMPRAARADGAVAQAAMLQATRADGTMLPAAMLQAAWADGTVAPGALPRGAAARGAAIQLTRVVVEPNIRPNEVLPRHFPVPAREHQAAHQRGRAHLLPELRELKPGEPGFRMMSNVQIVIQKQQRP